MKPAAQTVVRKIQAGVWPSALEVGAMLFESGCAQAEGRVLVNSYQAALAGRATAEDALMAELRSFSLGRE